MSGFKSQRRTPEHQANMADRAEEHFRVRAAADKLVEGALRGRTITNREDAKMLRSKGVPTFERLVHFTPDEKKLRLGRPDADAPYVPVQPDDPVRAKMLHDENFPTIKSFDGKPWKDELRFGGNKSRRRRKTKRTTLKRGKRKQQRTRIIRRRRKAGKKSRKSVTKDTTLKSGKRNR